MMLRFLTAIALLSPCTSQNLLQWNSWTEVNPNYVQALTVTPSRIQWVPVTGVGGIEQTVVVPRSGFYFLNWPGANVATGCLDYQVYVAGILATQRAWQESCGKIHVSREVYLSKGQRVTVKFLSTGIGNPFSVDQWRLSQPTLQEVTGPAIGAVLRNDFYRAELYAHAPRGTVIAIGAALAPTPISIPGLGNALELDPMSFFVLTVSPAPGATFRATNLPRGNWGPFYLQALSPTSFGPSIKL